MPFRSKKNEAKRELNTINEKVPRKPLYLNTRTFTSHLIYGPYIWAPVLCSLMWLGGLLALLGLWVHHGKPRYAADESSVVFISDVGGHYHKFFIGMTCVTGGLYILSSFAERWLRHLDRLPPGVRRREKIFNWLSIFFTIVGSVGLALLGIFDTFHHPHVHWSMTCVFVVGTALAAIFQSAEVWSLHKDHPDRRHLLRNSVYKLFVVTLAVLCAIAFGATYAVSKRGRCKGTVTTQHCNRVSNGAAALEWTVAFILTFYFLTLVADLWPAGKTSPRYMRQLARWQEKHDPHSEHNFAGRAGFQNTSAWEGQGGHAMDPEDPRVGVNQANSGPVVAGVGKSSHVGHGYPVPDANGNVPANGNAGYTNVAPRTVNGNGYITNLNPDLASGQVEYPATSYDPNSRRVSNITNATVQGSETGLLPPHHQA